MKTAVHILAPFSDHDPFKPAIGDVTKLLSDEGVLVPLVRALEFGVNVPEGTVQSVTLIVTVET